MPAVGRKRDCVVLQGRSREAGTNRKWINGNICVGVANVVVPMSRWDRNRHRCSGGLAHWSFSLRTQLHLSIGVCKKYVLLFVTHPGESAGTVTLVQQYQWMRYSTRATALMQDWNVYRVHKGNILVVVCSRCWCVPADWAAGQDERRLDWFLKYRWQWPEMV